MLIEASHLLKRPVLDAEGKKLGRTDAMVFDGKDGRLYGFQVAVPGLVNRFRALNFYEVLHLSRASIIVDQENSIVKDMRPLDQVFKETGAVIGIVAKTESGKKLGKVTDVLLDEETGFMIRFYIRSLMMERIIPRQYLVAITPKAIVFRDIVDQPTFDQVASMEAAPA